MEGMRPSLALAALAVTSLTACGGSSGEAAPPAAPTSESEPAPSAGPSKEAPKTDDAPAAAPTAEPAEDADKPLGEGDTRTQDAIAAPVKAHRKEARACYEEGRKQNGSLQGDLVVHFILKPSGEVKHAELNKERSTITEPSVVKCVIDVVTKIQFPKSSKGLESTVNYPFNFTP